MFLLKQTDSTSHLGRRGDSPTPLGSLRHSPCIPLLAVSRTLLHGGQEPEHRPADVRNVLQENERRTAQAALPHHVLLFSAQHARRSPALASHNCSLCCKKRSPRHLTVLTLGGTIRTCSRAARRRLSLAKDSVPSNTVQN